MKEYCAISGLIKGDVKDVVKIRDFLEKIKELNEQHVKKLQLDYFSERKFIQKGSLGEMYFESGCFGSVKESLLDVEDENKALSLKEIVRLYPSVKIELIGKSEFSNDSEHVIIDKDGVQYEKDEFVEYYFNNSEEAEEYGWESLDDELIETEFYREKDLPGWISPVEYAKSNPVKDEDDSIVKKIDFNWKI